MVFSFQNHVKRTKEKNVEFYPCIVRSVGVSVHVRCTPPFLLYTEVSTSGEKQTQLKHLHKCRGQKEKREYKKVKLRFLSVLLKIKEF